MTLRVVGGVEGIPIFYERVKATLPPDDEPNARLDSDEDYVYQLIAETM
ncbi:hypothetical protein A2U01_0111342, partial [Trifolium medium]|nr:hypothetical protein [Trifolium medium]